MSIAENLKKILSARYGKDVRQSIHDAIHTCYEDGKAGATDLIARESIENIESSLQGAEESIETLSANTDERLLKMEGTTITYRKLIGTVETSASSSAFGGNRGCTAISDFTVADEGTYQEGDALINRIFTNIYCPTNTVLGGIPMLLNSNVYISSNAANKFTVQVLELYLRI